MTNSDFTCEKMNSDQELCQKPPCVLMFSGGRDSTLAAVRLQQDGFSPILATVTSDHLTGIELVHQRLRELAHILPHATPWIHVRQPSDLLGQLKFASRTCLPCQHSYVIVAASIAMHYKAKHIAMGYAMYQGGWPEQTPAATALLKAVLSDFGISLVLPCYDLDKKETAINLLGSHALANESLEQKCLRQVTNEELDADSLGKELETWEAALRQTMENISSIKLELIEQQQVGGV
jgi:hypothetical protein